MDIQKFECEFLHHLYNNYNNGLSDPFHIDKNMWEGILMAWPERQVPHDHYGDFEFVSPQEVIDTLREKMRKRQAIPWSGTWYDVQLI